MRLTGKINQWWSYGQRRFFNAFLVGKSLKGRLRQWEMLRHVHVCVCNDVASCSVFICVCVCTFLCTGVPVLPVCANECEAGDYVCVSKGTGVCSQELQRLSWGGYVYNLTPAFEGPGCLSETISFLCGPFECESVTWMRWTEAICMFLQHFETENNRRWPRFLWTCSLLWSGL